MKAVKTVILVCAIIILFCLCSCKKNNNNHNITEPNATQSQNENPKEYEHVTEQAGNETVTEEPTTDNFRFDQTKAVVLGDFDSNIYGKLTVYLQDNHLAVVDEFGSLLCSMSSEGYTVPSGLKEDEKVLESADMDFDGYDDLRLLYRKTTFNSYYLCFMWNMKTKSYDYYLPLSSIASPVFNPANQTVTSYNKESSNSSTVTVYRWEDGDLSPQSHTVSTGGEGSMSNAPQDVDTAVAITDGKELASVVLNGNPDSSSRWICKIENENTVELYSDAFKQEDNTFTFTFKGKNPGTTTVVFRYATGWDDGYVKEKIFNITVGADKKLKIVSIE